MRLACLKYTLIVLVGILVIGSGLGVYLRVGGGLSPQAHTPPSVPSIIERDFENLLEEARDAHASEFGEYEVVRDRLVSEPQSVLLPIPSQLDQAKHEVRIEPGISEQLAFEFVEAEALHDDRHARYRLAGIFAEHERTARQLESRSLPVENPGSRVHDVRGSGVIILRNLVASTARATRAQSRVGGQVVSPGNGSLAAAAIELLYHSIRNGYYGGTQPSSLNPFPSAVLVSYPRAFIATNFSCTPNSSFCLYPADCSPQQQSLTFHFSGDRS